MAWLVATGVGFSFIHLNQPALQVINTALRFTVICRKRMSIESSLYYYTQVSFNNEYLNELVLIYPYTTLAARHISNAPLTFCIHFYPSLLHPRLTKYLLRISSCYYITYMCVVFDCQHDDVTVKLCYRLGSQVTL